MQKYKMICQNGQFEEFEVDNDKQAQHQIMAKS
jgi:hypothetical protein